MGYPLRERVGKAMRRRHDRFMHKTYSWTLPLQSTFATGFDGGRQTWDPRNCRTPGLFRHTEMEAISYELTTPPETRPRRPRYGLTTEDGARSFSRQPEVHCEQRMRSDQKENRQRRERWNRDNAHVSPAPFAHHHLPCGCPALYMLLRARQSYDTRRR